MNEIETLLAYRAIAVRVRDEIERLLAVAQYMGWQHHELRGLHAADESAQRLITEIDRRVGA